MIQLKDEENGTPSSPQSPRYNWRLFFVAFVATQLVIELALPQYGLPILKTVTSIPRLVSDYSLSPSKHTSSSSCAQFPPLVPSPLQGLDAHRDLVLDSDEYRNYSVGVLSGFVQVRSESFDDLGKVGEDPRFGVFFDIEAYLEKTFPLIYEKFEFQKINTHGLLYTLRGQDPSLKPALFMGHVDTVPVNGETLDDWTYPPFEGHYDGTYVWGRGSSDCKNTVSAVLEAVTLLLTKDFKPKRTILISFGFDEEVSGYRGAKELSKAVKEIWGEQGLAFILDEGGLGIGKMYGTGFALPATSEKGYLDVKATLHTPGGHSSIPPLHTGIGMLSSFITSLESAPYTPSLSIQSPIFDLLQCAAEYGNLSNGLRKAIKDGNSTGKKGDRARREMADRLAELSRMDRYLVTTSQAVDVFHAGVKVNALPETSSFIINNRVSVDSNTKFVKDKITRHAKVIAERYNLDLDAFGESFSFLKKGDKEAVSGGKLTLEGLGQLEPAPVSPTSSAAWELLASSIQHAYAHKFDELVVSPCIMTGNTDTRFFWDLSTNIYRFTPADRTGDTRIHTVDERLLFDDHLEAIWFYHELIRNADETAM